MEPATFPGRFSAGVASSQGERVRRSEAAVGRICLFKVVGVLMLLAFGGLGLVVWLLDSDLGGVAFVIVLLLGVVGWRDPKRVSMALLIMGTVFLLIVQIGVLLTFENYEHWVELLWWEVVFAVPLIAGVLLRVAWHHERRGKHKRPDRAHAS